MENLGQTLTRWAVVVPLLGLLAGRVEARSVDDVIPDLFGGTLSTFVDPRAGRDAQRPRFADQFRNLAAAVATARSQVPLPSASGAFSYVWDDEADTFLRSQLSLGPTLAERGRTLGRGVMTIGASYTRVSFDTFNGESLSHLHSAQPAISTELLAQLPAGDRLRAEDDLVETRLRLDLDLDLWSLGVAYGVTDDIDISLLATVNRARLRAHADATVADLDGDGGAFFTVDQKGVITDGTGACAMSFRCATDTIEETAVGTGDVFLRAKWHGLSLSWADFALAGVFSIPTGNAGELLGFNDPTLTPWLIVSSQWGVVSPHVNAGYSIRGGSDVSQAEWIAGADVAPLGRLTLSVDFVGQHGAKRNGPNDDIYQAAIGAKANLFGGAVAAVGVQLPLNRQGLRADVIYTAQLEWTLW